VGGAGGMSEGEQEFINLVGIMSNLQGQLPCLSIQDDLCGH